MQLKLRYTSGRCLTYIVLSMVLLLTGCNTSPNQPESAAPTTGPTLPTTEPTLPIAESTPTKKEPVIGCIGQTYPPPEESPYILPYLAGETFSTGLTNCSSSYHGTNQPDQYAFDFDMPVGTPFIAARAGTVYRVVEDAPSGGGGTGNYLSIDHHDGTYGLYYHSPEDGIDVAVGDEVEQGDVLGITGRSGLAGYPHLHFIVVSGSPKFPYEGIAISFRNASPPDTALKSYTSYTALP
jgi:hypothetical protein